MDRWREEPALLDAEEFADHIARHFEVPEETFAERFFAGVDTLHRRPKSQAEMVVGRAQQRLHAYEFDLNRLEYVIVEEKERLVVDHVPEPVQVELVRVQPLLRPAND